VPISRKSKIRASLFACVLGSAVVYRYATDEHRFMRQLAAYSMKPPSGYTDLYPLPSNTRRQATGIYFGREMAINNEDKGQQLVRQMLKFFPRSEHWDLRWNCVGNPPRGPTTSVSGVITFHGKKYELEVYEETKTSDGQPDRLLGLQFQSYSQVHPPFDKPAPRYVEIYNETGQVTCPEDG
jgi:hypothetical protein